jgi:hypothetical protein
MKSNWRNWRDRQYLRHWRPHRRHRYHMRVLLTVTPPVGEPYSIELIPEGIIRMATTINVGQTQGYQINCLDSGGNLITPQPTFDAAPAWSDDTPATDTLTASADGLTATALGLVGGTDTISVSLNIGGVPFSATEALTVVAAASQVASIAIAPSGPATP